MSIPIGFRSELTDEELVGDLLYPKVMGFELPCDGILERDVYGDGAEPWNLFSDADNWHTNKEGTKKTIYVFTKPNSKRVSRRAGRGAWIAQTGPKSVQRSGTCEIIGCARMLSFRCPNAAEEDLGNCWIMQEYSLGQSKTDLVLCKITKWSKKASRIPVTTGERGGGEEIEREGCKKQKF